MRFSQGIRKCAASLGVFLAVCFSVGAAPASAAGEPEVYFGPEIFTWKEFGDAGDQLLKEHGARYAVGFAYTHEFPDHLVLKPRVELFGGTVDYDGQACDIFGTCVPSSTDTDYFGFKFEIDAGARMGDRVRIEPFAGLGIRTWVRDINDSYTALGVAVGYTENWATFYGRLGMRADLNFSKESRLFFEGGVKLPVSTTNYIDDVNVSYNEITLHPGNKSSFFAEAGVKLHVFKISAFYDSMRFKKSDIEYQYDPFLGAIVAHWQPKSEADIFGVRVGAAF